MLVGDLFYEAALAERTSAFLARCRAAGLEVLVGDPFRTPLPRKRLRLVSERPAPDFGDAAGSTLKPAAVFAFEG